MYKKLFLYYVAWTTSLVSMMGSLYFSEIKNLPPCILCWYQRIAMYPLVAILAVGIIKKDRNAVIYALPFSIAGLLISIYHNLLYYGIIPEGITTCSVGISCTTRQIEWLGFVTIPFLSLVAFIVINACLIIYWKGTKNE